MRTQHVNGHIPEFLRDALKHLQRGSNIQRRDEVDIVREMDIIVQKTREHKQKRLVFIPLLAAVA